jgi:phosphoglycerol transferase
MLLSSIALALLSASLWRRTITGTLASTFITASLLLSLLLAGLFLLADSLSGTGIDESVLFHLRADLDGVGLSEFRATILYSFLYLAALSLIGFIIFFSSKRDKRQSTPRSRVALAAVTLAGSFAVNPGAHDIAYLATTYSLPSQPNSPKSREGALPPKDFYSVDNTALELSGKNLVYIYLESFERTYLDEAIFPGLAPNLKAIEAASLTFTNIHQTVASNWTIAGMVNSQCGLPLLVPGGQGNSMSGVGRFLPKANCIGDVLSDNGYQLHYIGGANKDFAGKGAFYKTHGFQRVEGVWDFSNNIRPNRDLDPSFVTKGLYRSAWGLFDDTLLEEVKTRYSELSQQSRPFALFSLTLDTHGKDGHVSKHCADIAYLDGANPMLNAIHCADKLIADVYQFITRHANFENTVLVIASDHLAMPNSATNLLKQGNRRNLFLVSLKNIAPAVVETNSAPVDIAPTVLNFLGADIDGLGFGRDLFSQDNLMARYENVGRFNHELLQHRQFLYRLWDFPQLNDGLKIDVADKSLWLEGEALKYPALVMVGENLRVESVRFSFWTPKKLADHFANKAYDQAYIWIDSCPNLSPLHDNQALKALFCLAIGRLVDGKIDQTGAELYPLVKDFTLTYEQLTDIFSSFKKGTLHSQAGDDQPLNPGEAGSFPHSNDRFGGANQLPRVARLGGKSRSRDANSLELLDRHKESYQLFEIDLSWASDDRLVCLRDWGEGFSAAFGIEPEGSLSEAEFKTLVSTHSDFTQCTLGSLARWLREHPDPRVVVNVREKPIKAYELIADSFPDLQERFIPVVADQISFKAAARLGYEDIIWNLFRTDMKAPAIIAQLASIKPFAILLSRNLAQQGLAELALAEASVPSYVATINSREEFEKYIALGVGEVYSDLPPLR